MLGSAHRRRPAIRHRGAGVQPRPTRSRRSRLGFERHHGARGTIQRGGQAYPEAGVVLRGRGGLRAREATLIEFDLRAAAEQAQLETTLRGLRLNETDPTRFADLLAQLGSVLAAERTNTIEGFDAQGRSAVTGLYGNLTDYAKQLRLSDTNPGTPMAIYEEARSEFNRVTALARMGDYEALTDLTGVSQTYLDRARNIYGGGVGYADAYSAVMEILNRVGDMPVDTLTASAQEAITREQTDVLNAGLSGLKAELALLRSEVRQGNTAPASAA